MLYLEAGETELKNDEIRVLYHNFAITELGQMSWSSTYTKIWTRQQLYHCTQRLDHEDISMLCFKTLLAVIKDVKIVKNHDGGL